jgi:ribose 5-phosphate isomerase B
MGELVKSAAREELVLLEFVIGCDNAAVELKTRIICLLRGKNLTVEDMGCESVTDKINYPRVAQKVCKKIIESRYAKRGILICGTGIGMCISANKFKGIRAAVCHDTYSAERSILSNDGNVLCLGARVIGPVLAEKIVEEWIGLEFIEGASTVKVQEIIQIEKDNLR